MSQNGKKMRSTEKHANQTEQKPQARYINSRFGSVDAGHLLKSKLFQHVAEIQLAKHNDSTCPESVGVHPSLRRSSSPPEQTPKGEEHFAEKHGLLLKKTVTLEMTANDQSRRLC